MNQYLKQEVKDVTDTIFVHHTVRTQKIPYSTFHRQIKGIQSRYSASIHMEQLSRAQEEYLTKCLS
ncbi:hypothetical protein LY78DRAFT_664246, partial [Colletotrichum sublineola]